MPGPTFEPNILDLSILGLASRTRIDKSNILDLYSQKVHSCIHDLKKPNMGLEMFIAAESASCAPDQASWPRTRMTTRAEPCTDSTRLL